MFKNIGLTDSGDDYYRLTEYYICLKMTICHLYSKDNRELFMPRVSEEYYENKKREIIDAALRVCARKPVTSVVMNDVIAETGFSHGVVYRYYKDLDEIFRDLVIHINSGSHLRERLYDVLDEPDHGKWENTVYRICDLLADYLQEEEMDILKISVYSDMLALSEPERTGHIAEQLSGEGVSPLIYLVASMKKYLDETVKKQKLKPIRSVDEIISFMVVTFHGAKLGYVISENYENADSKGKYNPEKMFSCLADSVILMLGGKIK